MKVLWGLRPMGIPDGPVRLPLLITCGPVWKTYGSLAEKWSSYYLVPPKNATGPWVWDQPETPGDGLSTSQRSDPCYFQPILRLWSSLQNTGGPVLEHGPVRFSGLVQFNHIKIKPGDQM